MVDSLSPGVASNPMNRDRFGDWVFGVSTDFDWFAVTLYCGWSDAFWAAGETGFNCSSSLALSKATFRKRGESPNGFWIRCDRAASVLILGTGTAAAWAGWVAVLLNKPPEALFVVLPNKPPPLEVFPKRPPVAGLAALLPKSPPPVLLVAVLPNRPPPKFTFLFLIILSKSYQLYYW